jgi:putative flippase GtrA
MKEAFNKTVQWGSLKQLLRYGCTGVVVNSVGYVIYLFVAWLFDSPKGAVGLLYPVGAAWGYFMHARYSFKYSGSHTSAVARYTASHIAGFALNLTVLWVGVDILGVRHQFVQLAAILIVAIQLFLMLKFWAFSAWGNSTDSL